MFNKWRFLTPIAGLAWSIAACGGDGGGHSQVQTDKVPLFEACGESEQCETGTCEAVPDLLCNSGPCLSYCSARCGSDDDCRQVSAAAICVEGTCAPACDTQVYSGVFCEGERYVSCSEADGSRCKECGCAGLQICDEDTNACMDDPKRKADGKSCSSDQQCLSNYCLFGSCNPGTGNPCTPDTCKGTSDYPGTGVSHCRTDGETSYCANGCEIYPEGARCGDDFYHKQFTCSYQGACEKLCEQDSDCILRTEACVRGICRGRSNRVEGEYCDFHADCASGNCSESACVPALGLDAACETSSQCISGLCIERCLPTGLGDGIACMDHAQCADGLACLEGVCRPRLAKLEDCNSNLECETLCCGPVRRCIDQGVSSCY